MKNRPILIVGNWKMNKTIAETRSFISGLAVALVKNEVNVGLAVPYTMIAAAAEAAYETPIMIGAQNVSNYSHGAYTGEISCTMVKDAGATFALVGHSERRHVFHETDALANQRILKCLESSIKPILCIGETLTEHQSGKAHEVLSRQILEGLKGVDQTEMGLVAIAYEPVWAIGTNQAATPQDVQKTHVFCRDIIAKEWGRKVADHIVIQYGGSVSPANAAALLEQPDVDGLLVGGASLSLDSFSKIVLARI